MCSLSRAPPPSPRLCAWSRPQKLQPGWEQASADDGRTYYVNASTGDTSWEAPLAAPGAGAGGRAGGDVQGAMKEAAAARERSAAVQAELAQVTAEVGQARQAAAAAVQRAQESETAAAAAKQAAGSAVVGGGDWQKKATEAEEAYAAACTPHALELDASTSRSQRTRALCLGLTRHPCTHALMRSRRPLAGTDAANIANTEAQARAEQGRAALAQAKATLAAAQESEVAAKTAAGAAAEARPTVLQKGWVQAADPTGKTYYVNTATDERAWEAPTRPYAAARSFGPLRSLSTLGE